MSARTPDDLQARIEEYEACVGYQIRDSMHEFGVGYLIFTTIYDINITLERRGAVTRFGEKIRSFRRL